MALIKNEIRAVMCGVDPKIGLRVFIDRLLADKWGLGEPSATATAAWVFLWHRTWTTILGSLLRYT